MLLLAFAIQKVELMDHKSWIAENTGSLVIASAAVFAATLAALVSILTQRWQLAHDRHLRNQDHTREVVDAAVARVTDTHSEVSRFLGSVIAVEQVREDVAEDDQEGEEALAADSQLMKKLKREQDAAYPMVMDLFSLASRLEMRLGDKHPIVEAHRSASDALTDIFLEALPGTTENRDSSAAAEDEARMKTFREAFAELSKACHAWFNQ
jgi:prophage maintenance system killer protein